MEAQLIELAWTVIPILIVVVLFLATARVIHAIQDWEFRYQQLSIVAANELQIPVSDGIRRTPT